MHQLRVCLRGRGSRVVSEAWLAVLVPLALMAAALGMQHLERYLLGPAPATEDDPVPRRRAVAQPTAPRRPQPRQHNQPGEGERRGVAARPDDGGERQRTHAVPEVVGEVPQRAHRAVATRRGPLDHHRVRGALRHAEAGPEHRHRREQHGGLVDAEQQDHPEPAGRQAGTDQPGVAVPVAPAARAVAGRGRGERLHEQAEGDGRSRRGQREVGDHDPRGHGGRGEQHGRPPLHRHAGEGDQPARGSGRLRLRRPDRRGCGRLPVPRAPWRSLGSRTARLSRLRAPAAVAAYGSATAGCGRLRGRPRGPGRPAEGQRGQYAHQRDERRDDEHHVRAAGVGQPHPGGQGGDGGHAGRDPRDREALTAARGGHVPGDQRARDDDREPEPEPAQPADQHRGHDVDGRDEQ